MNALYENVECASPVCSTMICAKCGECPNRCGFGQDERSPHDVCSMATDETEQCSECGEMWNPTGHVTICGPCRKAKGWVNASTTRAVY